MRPSKEEEIRRDERGLFIADLREWLDTLNKQHRGAPTTEPFRVGVRYGEYSTITDLIAQLSRAL